jgi:hypothetical protein
LNAIELGQEHPQYYKNEWYHHAFVRKDNIVTEFINGVDITSYYWPKTWGGTRGTVIYGGGWSTTDVRNNIDELAIFDYAKYTKKFTPPMVPYNDIKQTVVDDIIGEVTVSGLTGITSANSKSYSLVDSSATETGRVWKTANDKWYIYFNDMNSYWCIASNTSPDSNDYVEVAYADCFDDPWSIEPIGYKKWYDNVTKVKISVTSNN